MIAVLTSTTIFSFLSMFHCAAMCGPLRYSFIKSKSEGIVYHAGRLISYSLIILSMHYFTFSAVESLQKWGASSLFVIFSLIFLFTFFLLGEKLGGIIQKRMSRSLINLSQKRLSRNLLSFLIGLMTGLMPCGVLYSFFLTIAMIRETSVVILSIVIFLFFTGLGVEVSNWALRQTRLKRIVAHKYFRVGVLSVSYVAIVYRFLGTQIIGLCKAI